MYAFFPNPISFINASLIKTVNTNMEPLLNAPLLP